MVPVCTLEQLILQNQVGQLSEVCRFLASTAQYHFREFWREDPQDKWFLQLLGPYLKIPNQGQLVTSWFQVQACTALCRTGHKLRNRLSGQGMATLVGKPAPHEDGGLVSWAGTQASFNWQGMNKRFLVPVSLHRGCVTFFPPAVIHRRIWSRRFLCAKQRYFSLTFIAWEAGFPEMHDYV